MFVVKNSPVENVHFHEKSNVASPVSGAPRGAAASTSADASSSSALNVLHPNVICDGCDSEIVGYRYKCIECPDYDLCMKCEPKMHNHHLMIRITDPNDAEICYKSKLSKRFLRHRRSESLCLKPEEKSSRHHYPHHHKRHASSASGVRPPTIRDVFDNIRTAFAAANTANVNETPINAASQPATASAPAAGATAEPKKVSKSANATPTTTPIAPPAYGFQFPTANGKQPCVPLKQGFDMLSHVANNFAAMMDPFATFMEQSANAYASAASAASATAAPSANATETTTMVKDNAGSATATATASANSTATAQPNAEVIVPTTGNSSPQAPAKKADEKAQEPMIIDCSDDEEDLRNLVTSLNVSRKSSDGNASATNKKDDRSEAKGLCTILISLKLKAILNIEREK